MTATRVLARKRRLYRVCQARGRCRNAVADTTHAAMSPIAHAAMSPATRAAMSPTETGCTGANSCATSATCSRASSASSASSAPAASEQRAGRCDQQCRYGGYCKKLGYPRHDDLPFVFNSASKPGNATRPDQVPAFVHAPS